MNLHLKELEELFSMSKPTTQYEQIDAHIKKYSSPIASQSYWVLFNTIAGNVGLCIAVHNLAGVWKLLAAVVWGLALVRLFILYHDLVHWSFFKSKKENDVWGAILAPIILTPFLAFRKRHLHHHAIFGM